VKPIHRYFIVLFLAGLQIFSPVAFAASQWGDCTTTTVNGVTYTGVATIQCLVPLFKNVVIAVLQLSGVGLFITLVIAGFSFIMGGGNPKQLEQARNTLTYAIIGLVIIVAAYLIIQIISAFTGVQGLNKFEIPKF
jgi:ABC-type Fe3+ transport system permease subunit